jgi:hypothetical protein
VSGLPVNKYEFKLLPPHFAFDDESISESLLGCFGPGVSSHVNVSSQVSMKPILRMCLAQLIYHMEWIKVNVSPASRLFQTYIMSNPHIYVKLKGKIICGYDSKYMVATGIPSHVNTLRQLQVIKEDLESLNDGLDRQSASVVGRVLEGIEDILDRRSFEQGNITSSTLKKNVEDILADALKKNLTEHGFFDILREMRSSTLSPSPIEMDESHEMEFTPYQYNGRFHRTPEGWVFPRVNLRIGWMLWCLGSRRDNVSPFRLFDHFDVQKSMRKELNEWKSVFGKMECYLKAVKMFVPPRDASSVNTMYDSCTELFNSASSSMRFHQLHVSTVAKKFRSVNVLALVAHASRVLEEGVCVTSLNPVLI